MTMNIRTLKVLGFTDSRRTGKGMYRPICDSCEAMVINGYPTHERGCRNAMHECEGCNTIIPTNQRYCEDCN